MKAARPPRRVQVVIVGAGLSGLVAGRCLEAAGVTELVLLEARERIGGRILRRARIGGSHLELGGEFTARGQPRLQALAAELGVAVEPLPGVARAAAGAASVRLHRGARQLEAAPFAGRRGERAAYAEAVAALDSLAAELPVEEPWTAPRAAELDAQTLAGWLAANVGSAPVRAALANSFSLLGGAPAELSLLYVLWVLRTAGSYAEYEGEVAARFVPGPSEIVARLAAGLRAPILTATPVRRCEQDAAMVSLRADGGAVGARAAVLALAPTQAAKIEFAPALPPLRDRLQSRWLQGHGGKVFAVYAEPWWRDEGLGGDASGHDLLPFALDVSPADGSEGILCGLVAATSENVAARAAELGRPKAFREAAVDALAAYFGPRARSPLELYVELWNGDRWSDGCGTGLPPGALSQLGPALRPRSGRIVWAGAETGLHEHMEGAVEAGERAAAEALRLL